MPGKKVIVLGGSGMLGSMVVEHMSKCRDLEMTATVRTERLAAKYRERFPAVRWRLLDAGAPDLASALEPLDGHDWVINAIGITKPLIHDDDHFEVERAIRINALLPHMVARRAEATAARVLQIATDCVYSGSKGGYIESDAHDPLDVYGKTKSLGEVIAPHCHHLRCSILGPEPKEHKFLLDWFLMQPKGAQLTGYVNQRWNGVTTLHFARLCEGIITHNLAIPHLQHVVPLGEITKHQLLEYFSKCFGREDVQISPAEATQAVDRTLKTANAELNRKLWELAGYAEPLSVLEMLRELSVFCDRTVVKDG